MTEDKHTLNNDCEQWDILGWVGRHSRDFLTSAVVIYDRALVVSGVEEFGPAHAPIPNESWRMCQLLLSPRHLLLITLSERIYVSSRGGAGREASRLSETWPECRSEPGVEPILHR